MARADVSLWIVETGMARYAAASRASIHRSSVVEDGTSAAALCAITSISSSGMSSAAVVIAATSYEPGRRMVTPTTIRLVPGYASLCERTDPALPRYNYLDKGIGLRLGLALGLGICPDLRLKLPTADSGCILLAFGIRVHAGLKLPIAHPGCILLA